jgi:hypothetical protein
MHDKATAASKTGNSFTAWREVTPRHNTLVDALIGAGLHVITTLRTKTAYDLVDDGNGKKKPLKVGLAPIQREGLEYEFTVVLDLSVDGHVATAAKDRTRLFDGRHWVPDTATGEALREWLEAGLDPLAALKARVSEINAVPHLENWWRAHSGEIAMLTPSDQGALKEHCAARKAALLQARDLRREGLRRAAAGGHGGETEQAV